MNKLRTLEDGMIDDYNHIGRRLIALARKRTKVSMLYSNLLEEMNNFLIKNPEIAQAEEEHGFPDSENEQVWREYLDILDRINSSKYETIIIKKEMLILKSEAQKIRKYLQTINL